MLAPLRLPWKKQRRADAAFNVACACGKIISGERRPEHQVLQCPACQADIFVLPRSPWPDLQDEAPAARPTRALRPRDWLLPLVSAALALAALVVVYQLFFAPGRFAAQEGPVARTPREDLGERKEQAEKLLGEGNFRLALDLLAPNGVMPDLSVLSPPERRRWVQVHQQAAILADLVSEPLADIVRHAAGVRPQEWLADFTHRYYGKSLIIDGDFRRSPQGAWQVRYPIVLNRETVVLAVADLHILQKIPTSGPERLLVGVRLAAIRLENPGPAWVIRVEPDSGVFLTHPAAAARACPDLTGAEVARVIERMTQWLEK